MSEFAEILREHRCHNMLHQKEIAKYTNTSVPYVCKLERGGYLPSPKYLKAFCRYICIPYEPMADMLIRERLKSLESILRKKYGIEVKP